MTKLNKKQTNQLNEAIHNTEALVNACRGNPSSCCVFNSLNEDYKQNIDLYVSTWILPQLKTLLES